ncbi:MAG: DUF4924 family protein [Bacteroides sp.]|nr:DUF4924 family protein [Roseburia sp.]MCM1346334.1 DUF4924 family protein [Bacteroides sp.]MCM1420923.1 DUF4924 family protein [Bacteroides sp.]
MYIARKLKEKNIAEYLLYMWQVEDIIRANGLDIDQLEQNYLSKFEMPSEQSAELRQWYSDLIAMMRDEGVKEKGHLQINKNIIILLTDLHTSLLKSPKHHFYSAAYYKALPFIVELRSRMKGNEEQPEIENCLSAMYGLMMLRLQNKPIGADTQKAMDDIATLLGMLADYYKKDKNGELEL